MGATALNIPLGSPLISERTCNKDEIWAAVFEDRVQLDADPVPRTQRTMPERKPSSSLRDRHFLTGPRADIEEQPEADAFVGKITTIPLSTLLQVTSRLSSSFRAKRRAEGCTL